LKQAGNLVVTFKSMKTQLYWQELFALPVENLLFPVISKLFPASKPPAPMNHAKIFKGFEAGPTKMPLGNWYPAGTNHLHQADFWRK